MDFLQSQFDVITRTPGVSPADVKFADQWLLKERSAEKAKVGDWMKQRRAANLDKRHDLASRLRDQQEELRELADAQVVAVTDHGCACHVVRPFGCRWDQVHRTAA